MCPPCHCICDSVIWKIFRQSNALDFCHNLKSVCTSLVTSEYLCKKHVEHGGVYTGSNVLGNILHNMIRVIRKKLLFTNLFKIQIFFRFCLKKFPQNLMSQKQRHQQQWLYSIKTSIGENTSFNIFPVTQIHAHCYTNTRPSWLRGLKCQPTDQTIHYHLIQIPCGLIPV